MSHSVKVTLIADQEIDLLGVSVNVHDLETIVLDSKGHIVGFTAIERLAKRKRVWLDGGVVESESKDAPDYEW